jgi:predicted porin
MVYSPLSFNNNQETDLEIRICTKALALGGAYCVSSLAFAQSSVTLYGVLDTDIDIANNGYGTQVKMGSGGSVGSRFGFIGTEDLGGGLSAIFTLENGFGVADGALQQGGLLFGRQAFVGFSSSKFGAITLGRHYSPEWWSFTQNDPNHLGLPAGLEDIAITTTAANGTRSTAGMLSAYSATVRMNNSVMYTSPTVGGLLVRAMYGFGGFPGSLSPGQTESAMFQYSAGPFDARAGIAHMEDNDGSGGYQALHGGISYKLSKLKFSVGYTFDKNNSAEVPSGPVVPTRRITLYNFAVEYQLSVPFTFNAEVTKLVNASDNLPESQNTYIYSLSAYYSLSKRTTLYLGYAQLRNRGGSTYSFSGATYAAGPAAHNATSRDLQIGIKHYF